MKEVYENNVEVVYDCEDLENANTDDPGYERTREFCLLYEITEEQQSY